MPLSMTLATGGNPAAIGNFPSRSEASRPRTPAGAERGVETSDGRIRHAACCSLGMFHETDPQVCVTHTSLSPRAYGKSVKVYADVCAAPTKALSALALSGLKARFQVE